MRRSRSSRTFAAERGLARWRVIHEPAEGHRRRRRHRHARRDRRRRRAARPHRRRLPAARRLDRGRPPLADAARRGRAAACAWSAASSCRAATRVSAGRPAPRCAGRCTSPRRSAACARATASPEYLGPVHDGGRLQRRHHRRALPGGGRLPAHRDRGPARGPRPRQRRAPDHRATTRAAATSSCRGRRAGCRRGGCATPCSGTRTTPTGPSTWTSGEQPAPVSRCARRNEERVHARRAPGRLSRRCRRSAARCAACPASASS